MSKPPARRRSVWLLSVVLAAWNVYGAYRLSLPMKPGHEGWIARQIGRTGRNHLALGLGVTKGANVVTMRHDGSLELHRSYSPLASWTVALPMAAGCGFDLSVRLPVLVSSNLFLIGLWAFAREVWGARTANLALVYAAFCPVFLFRYGLTCIFEILALGPLMVAAALFARPVRGGWGWLAIAAAALAAASYSWICWLVIVPCLARDVLAGRRRGALIVGAVVLVVPAGVHLALTGLASGDVRHDVLDFFQHISQRASAVADPARPVVTYGQIVGLMVRRWVRGIGLAPLAFTAACLTAVVAGRRYRGWRWVVVLFAFALPLNLARNIAFFHDFFIILFVPVAAVCAALGTSWLESRWPPGTRRVLASAVVIAVFVGLDVAPKYRLIRPLAADYEQTAIADEIGAAVRVDDLVIVNPTVCEVEPETLGMLSDAQREMSPRPYYCGEISQSVFVARDARDAERLAGLARAGQRVVLVEVGDVLFDLPPAFTSTPTRARRLVIGVRPSRVADAERGDGSRESRRR